MFGARATRYWVSAKVENGHELPSPAWLRTVYEQAFQSFAALFFGLDPQSVRNEHEVAKKYAWLPRFIRSSH